MFAIYISSVYLGACDIEQAQQLSLNKYMDRGWMSEWTGGWKLL